MLKTQHQNELVNIKALEKYTIVQNNIEYVNLRSFAKEIDANIQYDNAAKGIVVEKEDFFMNMQIGCATAHINDVPYTIDEKDFSITPIIIDQSTYVPLDFIKRINKEGIEEKPKFSICLNNISDSEVQIKMKLSSLEDEEAKEKFIGILKEYISDKDCEEVMKGIETKDKLEINTDEMTIIRMVEYDDICISVSQNINS